MTNSEEGAFAYGAQQGLTKREYFAGLAMQGIISGIFSSKEAYASFSNAANKKSISINQHIINLSLLSADELLKKLEIKEETV